MNPLLLNQVFDKTGHSEDMTMNLKFPQYAAAKSILPVSRRMERGVYVCVCGGGERIAMGCRHRPDAHRSSDVPLLK